MKLLAALALALALGTAPVLAAGFPVTIPNAFGDTTVPAAPRRVVSIGYVEQDFLYALGIAPVGVRNWWGDYAYATWPWAEAARQAAGATPEVLPTEELSLEQVLKLNPDLIIGTFVDMDQEQYDALSKIAPVIALPKGYPTWGAPWQEQLKVMDLATTGDTEKSDKIIADLEAKFASVRTAHPEFAGKTGTIVYYNEGNFLSYGPEDSASRFMVSLGLTFPPDLMGLSGDDNAINISAENIRLIDQDVMIWPIDGHGENSQDIVVAMPLYLNTRLAREGRSVWLNDGSGIYSAAISYQSPLSMDYLLDKVPPMVAAALDGDPATKMDIK